MAPNLVMHLKCTVLSMPLSNFLVPVNPAQSPAWSHRSHTAHHDPVGGDKFDQCSRSASAGTSSSRIAQSDARRRYCAVRCAPRHYRLPWIPNRASRGHRACIILDEGGLADMLGENIDPEGFCEIVSFQAQCVAGLALFPEYQRF